MRTLLRILTIQSMLLATVAGCGRERPGGGEESAGPEMKPPPTELTITAAELDDRIRGGLAAQLLGNLNGLPHEFEYFGEPGDVRDYTPGLPGGARTDDDTDIEWVYIYHMQQAGELYLPPHEITGLWKRHINRAIWSSNAYARQLMEIGIEPPLTGRIGINPWAVFNISGQFVCECFGLVSPGMPQTAARVGTHYTHVTIDGEPAQATQLFTAMIATAFTESDIDGIIDAGLEAIDPESEHREIVEKVRGWHARYPDDWRETRRLIRQTWAVHGDGDGRATRDGNGYELNSACTVAALLYGGGDLVKTLRTAFNLGWDADNNAATSATVVGVMKGWKWIESQGWDIADSYRNTTRPGMPEDETISGFARRLSEVARLAILQHGGRETTVRGEPGYTIKLQRPANVEPLPEPLDRMPALAGYLRPIVENDLAGEPPAPARAAYLALCLGMQDSLAQTRPGIWRGAVEDLAGRKALLEKIFNAPAHTSTGETIRQRAADAGLGPPEG